MDKADIILCQLLLGNSRLSYSELAEMLNLSVTAVHKRIQDLIESRVIRKFTAKLSLFQLGALHVLVFGRSKLGSVQSLPEKLEPNGLICLKKLKARNYALTCQDDNCVSCEAAVPAPNLTEEYGKVKALMKASFS
jgi:DNA-binding Lrp family transcriptional regulator